MTNRSLLILVAGEPVPSVHASRGGFPELIQQATGGTWQGEWATVDLRAGTALPEGREFAGVVVTGSAESLTARRPWMDRGLAYVQDLVHHAVPTLGICFGHQMLGEALGGRVAANPRGREIGSVLMHTSSRHPFLEPLSDEQGGSARGSQRSIVNMTHMDSVVELPSAACVCAHTPLEPFAFVQFGEQAWGVQFHPEMDGEVIRAYIHHRRDAIASEGLDVEQLLNSAVDTPHGRGVLSRFVAYVGDRASS